MDNDKLLKISDGRTAAAVFEWLNPLFKEIESGILGSLKSNFRAGTYTELVLACHVAQLCALEDIQNKIKSVSNEGESVAVKFEQEKENENA